MYAPSLGCARSGMNSGGMGLIPVAAVTGAASAVTSFTSILGKLGLNSSDPVKDKERFARIDGEFRGAMAGDPAAISCLREISQGVYRTSDNPQRLCAVGSAVAAAYGKMKWLEYQGRVTAGRVGSVLVGGSDIPTKIEDTIRKVVSNPLLIGGLVFGGYLLFRKQGR